MNLNFIKHIFSSDNHEAMITGIAFLIGLIYLVPVVLSAQTRVYTHTENAAEININRDSDFVKSLTFEMLSVNGKITPRPAVMSGYQFTPNFSAGIGIGFTPYDDPLSLIPLFVDLKYKFLNTGIAPFAFLRSGYGFSIKTESEPRIDNHSGGFTINPGTGIHFPLGDKAGLSLNIGFNIDKASFEQQLFNGGTLRRDLTYKRLNFGLAFTF